MSDRLTAGQLRDLSAKVCHACGSEPRYWVEPIPSASVGEPFFTHRVRDGIGVVCHASRERCDQILALLLMSTP